jgi:hypothetical protein
MTFSVNNIIQVSTKFAPGALGFANFGFAVLFITETEGVAAGLAVDEYRDYTNTADILIDGFTSVDEAYLAADKWLGATPNVRQLRIYVKPDADLSYVDTYARARDSFWWFITLNTIDLYDDPADTILAAGWNNSNETYFPNCAFDVNTIVPGDMTSISYDLTQLGYRFVHSTYNPDDRYAAFTILAWFATVNYNVDNSTITGEYKTITNSPAVNLTTTAQNALLDVQVKTGFISDVDLQGQTVKNRYINSITHSANNEWIDDVFNAAAFVNAIKVRTSNVPLGTTTKAGQTLAGQQAIINEAKNACEDYIDNGYLGERNYLNPDTGFEDFTLGYEILTVAEDILDLSPSERTERFSAPLRIRIFRAGAIHKAIIDLTIF